MSNQQDIERGVTKVLFEKDAEGKTRFGRELDEHIDRRLGRWLLTGGVSILGTIIVGAWWLAGQNAKINELDRRITDNEQNIQTTLSGIRDDISELRGLVIEALRNN